MWQWLGHCKAVRLGRLVRSAVIRGTHVAFSARSGHSVDGIDCCSIRFAVRWRRHGLVQLVPAILLPERLSAAPTELVSAAALAEGVGVDAFSL